MVNVTVLGGSGMLGSMVVDYFARDPNLKVFATVRSELLAEKLSDALPMVEWRLFDACESDRDAIFTVIENNSWIINAIGLTKPYTHDDNPAEIERAIRINSLFPFELAQIASETGGRVLQIATDCVYSGKKGQYRESDPHDPIDVYGKTKSLGEAALPNLYSLRTSIVGPEPKSNVFLLEWFRGQPNNAQIHGFTNHQWNGVTTLHFTKVCRGIIASDHHLPHVHHLVPTGSVSKANLLECFAQEFCRNDVSIIPTEAETIVDRTLLSENPSLNQRLWNAAGYVEPPTVPQMVAELAEYSCRITGI